jgi:hypothetical protein
VELVIDSPDAGPLAAQTSFLFHQGGEDFHLYAPDLPQPGDDANTMRMTLTHFSTPGFGLGTAGDRSGVNDQPPARTQAQVEAAICSLIAAERASQLPAMLRIPGSARRSSASSRATTTGRCDRGWWRPRTPPRSARPRRR